MASQYSIFKKGEQEFEQGQLPSNHLDLGSLPVLLGANNGHDPEWTIVSNKNIHNTSTGLPSFLKDSTSDQNETAHDPRIYKKDEKRLMSSLHHQKNQSGGDNAKSNRNGISNAMLQSQEAKFNSYYVSIASSEHFDQNSNYCNKNNLKGAKKYDQNIKAQNTLGYTLPLIESEFIPSPRNFNYPQMALQAHGFISQKQDFSMKDVQKNMFSDDTKKYLNIPSQKFNLILNNKKAGNEKNELNNDKLMAKFEVERHRKYFRPTDWQRLLYFIQEIILENNNGVRHLWKFMDNFKGTNRFKKGKRIFDILGTLGLDEVFDKLIAQEQKDRNQRKLKQSKIRSLIFSLVHRID